MPSYSLLHIIPIKGKRVALRPNAIITDNKIWVRQGEYFDLSQETKDYKEYLHFEPLTSKGLDKSVVRFWTFNKQGALKFETEIKKEGVRYLRTPKDPNLRSQSYWTLPTYVDAVYMDLDYAQEKWRGDEDPHLLQSADALLLIRIKKLREMAKKSFQ